MKKRLSVTFIVAIIISASLSAQVKETIPLPDSQKSGGMPLFEALNNRQSIRSYSSREPDRQDLSNLLWAAFGINRDDGRRTAPSARNWQETDIYLIMADGWYLYEPQEHALLKMGNEDLRKDAGSQDFVATAPLNLIYVADYERMTGSNESNREFYSAADVGFISQNVYLFCASEGMATVVRGLVDRDRLKEVLKLRPAQHVVFGQTVGYPGN
ncbi:MAG: SagB/ThcOx family dehydrogenase [Bacteroidales bacterium]